MLDKYSTYEKASSAAKSLNISSKAQYHKFYKVDPKLPSKPAFLYQDDWVSWPDFLGKEGFYSCYKEARRAAQSLHIVTMAQYLKTYKKDPKLPSDPQRVYKNDWQGFPDFLGKESFYPTYNEASKAAQALQIKTMVQYGDTYKADSRLPANPDVVYHNEWNGANDFLKKPSFYSSHHAASKAAKALHITSVPQYKQRYKLDAKLPSAPELVYRKDWLGWSYFLGKHGPYDTLEEARYAVNSLGLTSSHEYRNRYKEDPKLPCSPQKRYRDDWKGWSDFLGA